MAVDKKTQIERTQAAYDRAIKNGKREWAAAKNAPTDKEAGPHYHHAKVCYEHAKYHKNKLDELQNS